MNRLSKTRQRRDCDLNPGPSAPESSTITTPLPSHQSCIKTLKTKSSIKCVYGNFKNFLRFPGAKTVVRTVYGNSKGFEVKVGMHQGSGLSPLLFVIVMEAISREFRVALPWELLYADDLAVIVETEEELIKRLNEWKENVESKGMRVNMNKTKVMISGESQMVWQKAAR